VDNFAKTCDDNIDGRGQFFKRIIEPTGKVRANVGLVSSRPDQGCQMVHFQIENPNLAKFWRLLPCNVLVYFWQFGIFCGHMVYFVAVWFIL
jgi:hypothetical protein